MNQKIVGYHRDQHNDWVAELECGHFQHVLDDAGPDLHPAVGARQPGDDAQPVVEGALHRPEPLRQLSGRGNSGGRQQPGDLVDDAELLSHRAAVRVGVDQDRAVGAAELGGEADGHRRTPGRTCRPQRPPTR